jgi:poly(3-hydroxybutyrate) depolymerase
MRLKIVGLMLMSFASASAQGAMQPVTLDESRPPGENFDKADFRMWLPPVAGPLRAVVVLVPGSNGDGRPMVADSMWQSFAVRNRVALFGVRFTDKPHDQSFIEDYINVSKGSGQVFLDVLSAMAAKGNHAELAAAPLFLWGMSAGGQFDYEFVAWKPERVAAFVVNKGGIYYSALLPRAAREVPGLLFIGGKDLESRVATITGLFAVNRRGGALWALTEEPSVGHVVARSKDFGAMFFEDVMALRMPEGSMGLKPLAEKDGFIGDIHAKTFAPLGDGKVPSNPTAWLPTLRTAKAWQAVVTDTPFEK